MSRSKAPIAIALAAGGGLGYYFYRAGGSPRAAEKDFESDARRLASRLKGEAEQKRQSVDIEEKSGRISSDVTSKIEGAVSTVNKELSKTAQEAENLAKQARADALKKIDEFDRKVEEGAAKGKSWFSSWFGGK